MDKYLFDEQMSSESLRKQSVLSDDENTSDIKIQQAKHTDNTDNKSEKTPRDKVHGNTFDHNRVQTMNMIRKLQKSANKDVIQQPLMQFRVGKSNMNNITLGSENQSAESLSRDRSVNNRNLTKPPLGVQQENQQLGQSAKENRT